MDDMRNMLLTELIDKMHSRLADKMFPPDPSLDDQPAVTGISVSPETAEGVNVPAVKSPSVEEEKEIDVDKDAQEISDEDIDELLK